MPYNKGDFTQQGINGHVNATVRLNEKRLVNIDLTSNEEAEGCTITGTVKDLLNDKVYNIGSGGGGGGDDYVILPMTEVIWDGTGDGGQLNIDPDTSKVSDNEQVIIRLNVQGEEPLEILLFGTYDATAGPTEEDFSGITEGDPQVNITLKHNTERPDDPWYLVVSVGGEPMGGTYQVGVCGDIPHEVA